METLTWDEFDSELRWKQGEHVTLIGPTGQGKTTLAIELLKRRGPVCVFATKPRDRMVAGLVKDEGYWLCEKWPPPQPRHMFPKVVFWPPIDRMRDMSTQRQAFQIAIADIYEQGKWCLYFDELRYLTENLKLQGLITVHWLQGRSLGISVVGGSQRPYWIPQEAYDQSHHLFMWGENDDRNLRRYGEFSRDKDDLRDTLANLPACTSCDPDEICECGQRGYFVYLNTRSKYQCVSRLEVAA